MLSWLTRLSIHSCLSFKCQLPVIHQRSQGGKFHLSGRRKWIRHVSFAHSSIRANKLMLLKWEIIDVLGKIREIIMWSKSCGGWEIFVLFLSTPSVALKKLKHIRCRTYPPRSNKSWAILMENSFIYIEFRKLFEKVKHVNVIWRSISLSSFFFKKSCYFIIFLAFTSHMLASTLDFQRAALKTSDIILLFTTSEAKRRLLTRCRLFISTRWKRRKRKSSKMAWWWKRVK